MRFATLALCIGLTAALGQPAFAQSMTDDELLKLFENQRDAYKATKGGGGLTRGLTLVTLGADAPQTESSGLAGSAVVAESPSLATPPADGGMTALTSGDTGSGTVAQPGALGALSTDQVASAGTTTVAPAAEPGVVGVFPKELQVNVKIRFAFDSAKLNADQKPQLAQLCTVMKASDIGLFQIIGHTDASGTAEYNQRLSQLRAEEVKRFFVNDCGVAAARLQALGMGERLLRDQSNPKSGENRRVEFQALS